MDLRAALGLLAEKHRVRTVRVDSGGALNTALLEAGLVEELSLLVHPVIVGGKAPDFFVSPDESPLSFELAHHEKLDNGVLWQRYRMDG